MNTQATAVDPPAARRRRWAYSPRWYLIYLSCLAFQPAFDSSATTADWVLAGVLAVGGVVLCTWAAAVPEHRRLHGILAQVATGIVAVWWNAGATVFFVYAAAVAGRLRPRRVAVRWLAGLCALVLILAALSPVPMPYRLLSFGFPLLLVWLVGNEVIDDSEREREAVRLRVDNARIERLATLSERERIARDLHDLLGHTLTGIVVRAQLIRRLTATDPDRAAKEAADVERIARDALAEVRGTVSGWRHHALDAELDAARSALAVAGIALTVENDHTPPLSTAVEAALALAVREAVTNVVRHASAEACTIGIVESDGQVRLTISDDGVGATTPEGSGLRGMRERINALGGQVERLVGHGTTIRVTVPAQGLPA